MEFKGRCQWTEKTYLYLRCWIVPKHLKDPLTIMANRVHNASHSSMLQGQFSKIM